MILEYDDKYGYIYLCQLLYMNIISLFTYFIKKQASINLIILI